MITSRAIILALLCGFGVWISVIRLARAEGDPCDAVNSLETLPVADRQILSGVCRLGDRADSWRKGAPHEYRKLFAIIERLLPRSHWEKLVLAGLMPDSLFTELSEDASGSQKSESDKTGKTKPSKKSRAGAGKSDDCNKQWQKKVVQFLKTALPAYREGIRGRPLGAPVFVDTDECWPVKPKVDEETAFAKVVLLAPEGSKVHALSSWREGALLTVPIAKSADGKQIENVAGYQLYILQLPVGTHYLITVEPNQTTKPLNDFPLSFEGTAKGTVAFVTHTIAHVPVDVRIAADAEVRAYINGRRLTMTRNDRINDAFVRVPVDPDQAYAGQIVHRLLVLDSTGQRVLANRNFTLKPGVQEPLHLDLRTADFDNAVGLYEVSTHDCAPAGLDATRVQAFVLDHLTKRGRNARDLSSWAHAIGFVADLEKSLGQIGAEPVGAERGRLDSIGNLGSAAEEILRQGFGTLLRVRMHCSRRDGQAWNFSIAATAFNLSAISRAARDPILGMTIDGVAHTEIELISDRTLLSTALASAISELYDLPFIGLPELPDSQPFFDYISTDFQVSTPDKPSGSYIAALTLQAMDQKTAQTACGRLSDVHSLRSRWKPDQLDDVFSEPVIGEAVKLKAGQRRQRVRLSAEPNEESNFLVRIALVRESDKKTVATDFRCIDVTKRPVGVWFDLQAWFPTTNAKGRTEASRTVAVVAGIDWQRAQGELSMGAGVGYSRTTREGKAPGSWSGVDAVEFPLSGMAKYQIVENAVYGVFTVELGTTLCGLTDGTFCYMFSRMLELSLRTLIMPGVHFIDKDDIDPAFSEFRGEATDIAVDLGLFEQIGIGVRVAESVGLRARLGLGSNRILDFVRSEQDAAVVKRLLWNASLEAACEL